jgi:hypothetical protein
VQDNGGNTNTLALEAVSPAVDAIPPSAPSCTGTDQRDLTRLQGSGCDIGEFELIDPLEGLSTAPDRPARLTSRSTTPH